MLEIELQKISQKLSDNEMKLTEMQESVKTSQTQTIDMIKESKKWPLSFIHSFSLLFMNSKLKLMNIFFNQQLLLLLLAIETRKNGGGAAKPRFSS